LLCEISVTCLDFRISQGSVQHIADVVEIFVVYT